MMYQKKVKMRWRHEEIWVRTNDPVQSPTVQMSRDLKETLMQYVLTAYVPCIRPNGSQSLVGAGGGVGAQVKGVGKRSSKE